MDADDADEEALVDFSDFLSQPTHQQPAEPSAADAPAESLVQLLPVSTGATAADGGSPAAAAATAAAAAARDGGGGEQERQFWEAAELVGDTSTAVAEAAMKVGHRYFAGDGALLLSHSCNSGHSLCLLAGAGAPN